jgi:hypothetical protein
MAECRYSSTILDLGPALKGDELSSSPPRKELPVLIGKTGGTPRANLEGEKRKISFSLPAIESWMSIQ